MNKNTTIHIFSLLSLFLLISTCEHEEIKEQPIKPVRYETVKYLGEKQSRSFTGVTKSSDITDLSFRLGGVVTNITVSVGDRVVIGQQIAVLDNFETQNQVNQTLAAQRSALSAVETASSNLDRVKTLYERSNVSLSDYEAARNQYQAALSQYETAKKSVELAKRQLAYTDLKSPVNGVINKKPVTSNEQVSPGQTIVEIQSGNELEAEVGVPENYISSLEVGDNAEIVFPTLNNLKMSAKVSEVSFAAGQSSTYPVTVKLDSVNSQLRPGMAVKILLKPGSRVKASAEKAEGVSKVLVVPEQAVKEDPEGMRYVYVITPIADTPKHNNATVGEAKKEYVEIGGITPEGFVVKSGLKLNDIVAVAGIDSMYDGMQVLIKNM